MTIITKGMGAIAKLAKAKSKPHYGYGTTAAKKARGQTVKVYREGRTDYVRPGDPTYTMKPKIKRGQGKLFSIRNPKKISSKQLRFKFKYPDRKKSAVKQLKTNIKKAQVK
jgi:hypothetical protein